MPHWTCLNEMSTRNEVTMQVEMLESRCGSEDGFSVRVYKQGERYDMADGLAREFVRDRVAVEVQGNEPVDTSALRPPRRSPFDFRFPDAVSGHV